jgi:predicted dehydrogenase
MIQKIREGAMGQVQLIRAYRMDEGYCMGPFDRKGSEVMFQIARASLFPWASSGIFLELMIHQIDECCWIKDGYPVAAHGVGGRVAGSKDCSQNLDAYSIEYTFADGTKALVTGRYTPRCFNDFATFIHGTKCSAQFSGNIHAPTTHFYKDQRMTKDNIAWKSPKEMVNPWQNEWNVLLNAIHGDKPHNEAERASYTSLTAIMGRAAVHTGRIITWDEMLKSKFSFCPNIASLTADSPAPAQSNKDGVYTAPVPGVWNEI